MHTDLNLNHAIQKYRNYSKMAVYYYAVVSSVCCLQKKLKK